MHSQSGHKHFLARAQFQLLFEQLAEAGYKLVAPVVKDGAIIFDTITKVDELPWGWLENAAPGSYRLQQVDEQKQAARCFTWNTGPQGIKPRLFKPQQTMWYGEQSDDGLRFKEAEIQAEAIAFIGLRACDLAALNIQDQHFMHGPYPDPHYTAQRKNMLIVAVNCQRSADTCFCVSTGDGPEASFGYDILLDELNDGYLLQSKSEIGHNIIVKLPTREPQINQLEEAKAQINQARLQPRKMPGKNQLLQLLDNLSHQQWYDIAQRCLACGNCASVCPTCFCSKQVSHGDLANQHFQQERLWDSCFSEQHGYIAGKKIRGEISQRYRQWLIHKLVTWQQQFNRSGCVGCGRCISWCPVGIDLVAETHALLPELAEAENQAQPATSDKSAGENP